MKKFKTIIYGSLITLGILSIIILCKEKPFEKDIYKLNKIKNTKLMIVAHPDDDILWGGAHLIEDNYLVVCITCGPTEQRVKEFKNVMDSTGSEYIMLGYPDKTNGKRDNWSSVQEDIKKDIKKIFNSKKWDQIVTHNPEGEYGHEHHKMTSKFVTDIVNHNKLYYFGKYYKKDQIPENIKTINEESYNKKVNKILPLYTSQKKVIDSFKHMWKYENWVEYKNW